MIGQRWMVVGGDRGLGRSVVAGLVARGARVTVTDRPGDAPSELDGLINASGLFRPADDGDDVDPDLPFVPCTVEATVLSNRMSPAFAHGRRAVLAHVTMATDRLDDPRLIDESGQRMSHAVHASLTPPLALAFARRAPGVVVVGLHPVGADRLFEVLDGLDRAHSGRVLTWDGRVLPWGLPAP